MELTLYGRPNPRQAEFFASTAAHTAYGRGRQKLGNAKEAGAAVLRL